MGFKFAATTMTGNAQTNAHEFDGYAISPNDTLATYQAQVPKVGNAVMRTDALYVTGAGNINVLLNSAGDSAVLTVSANTLVPISVHQILATSTTATGIFALFRL